MQLEADAREALPYVNAPAVNSPRRVSRLVLTKPQEHRELHQTARSPTPECLRLPYLQPAAGERDRCVR